MTGIDAFDAAPLDHIDPDAFRAVLGLENPQIALTILDNPYLRHEIDGLVRGILPARAEHAHPDYAPVFACIAMGSLEMLDTLARYTTILVNHGAMLATMDGTAIDAALKWCGTRSLLDLIRKHKLPVFEHMPVLSLVSVEALEVYAQAVTSHILGVLPAPYHFRFCLRFPPGQIGQPVAFQYGESDRLKFLECVALAQAACADAEASDAAH